LQLRWEQVVLKIARQELAAAYERIMYTSISGVTYLNRRE
jgi:hypothetical protein